MHLHAELLMDTVLSMHDASGQDSIVRGDRPLLLVAYRRLGAPRAPPH